jgi:hypothetical protein
MSERWLSEFIERFSAYLPALTGGLLLVMLGLLVGWIVKRTIIRVLVLLRLDRLAGRAGWRTAFAKGDVRAAIYTLLGNVGMVLVFLVFLDNALQILGLKVLSTMIGKLVFYAPNLGLSAAVLVVGVLLANAAASRVEDVLEQEEAPHARLVGKICKAGLLSMAVALALWQLGFARQIILAAFVITFGACGVAFALAVGLGSSGAVRRGWEFLFGKHKDEES